MSNKKKNEVKKPVEPLSDITFMDSAEGMARRVLSDIEAEKLTENELIQSYQMDYQYGGRTYENVVKLGELIKKLSSSISQD